MKKINLFMLFVVFGILCINLVSIAYANVIVINNASKEYYSIELVKISGDISENLLFISGSGEVMAGNDVKVYLFGPTDEILIENAKVNGNAVALSFDDKGYFFIVPDKGKFYFEAEMQIKTQGQVKLYVPGPVNYLEFNIDNGSVVEGTKLFGVYGKQIIIQRQKISDVIVDGSFKYTFADRNSFYYQISFDGLGNDLGRIAIALKNGETVSSVIGVAEWKQQGNILILDFDGHKANVVINGFLDNGFKEYDIKIPFEQGKHKVVIESDPEKKLTIMTTAKEIDLSEVAVRVNYANARAFIASGEDDFNVLVEDLQLLPSLSAAVRKANLKIAITEKGSIVGEMQYSYANSGVDYIAIDVPGVPLYAATNFGAVKLTSSGDDFLLSLSKTDYGNLDLVYFDTFDGLKFVNLIDVPLAKTDLPISEQTTTIYFPKDYYVLNTFGASNGSELPGFKIIILFVLITSIIAWFLLRNIKFVVGYVVMSFGLVIFDLRLFLIIFAISLFVIIKKWFDKKQWKWIFAGAGALVVLGLIVIAVFSVLTSFSSIYNVKQKGMSYSVTDGIVAEEAIVPGFRGLEKIGEGEGAITVPTKTGVKPVKLEIPRVGKSVTVTNYIVTKENPVKLKLLLISKKMFYLLYIIALAAGVMCIRIYRKNS